MFKQIEDFMENFFSKFQCGFRKGCSTNLLLIEENPLEHY